MEYTASKLYLLNIIKTKILIVRSDKHWTLPGGKRDEYEDDPKKTLEREIDEELPGLIYRIQKIVNYKHKGWNNVVYIATSHYYDGSTIETAREILEYKWVKRSHLSYYSLYWAWFYPTIKDVI